MKVLVERSRRKTLTLTLTRGGDVSVRAPLDASDEAIRLFVSRHKKWIENRLAARKTLPLADGDEIFLFGEKYTLREGRTGFWGGYLNLPSEGREAALAALVKRLAAQQMRVLTETLAARHGFCYGHIRVTSARTRWGSCNKKGNIAYTFRIAFLPPELSEYVALHELCHTRHLDHSAAFWREVSAIMPDCFQRRKRLRTYGWLMNCL